MSEDHFWKRLIITAMLWMAASTITYGHILKEYRIESQQECDVEKKANPKIINCGNMDRFDAMLSSFFWPQHWSEELWK